MKLVIGAVVGLLVLILILLHTGPVQGRVLQAAQDYLKTHYDVDLQAGQFSYNLLTLSVDFTQLTAKAASKKAAPPFFAVDVAHVNLALARFWSGRFTIQEFNLTRPRIHVILADGEEGDLPNIPPQEKKSDTNPEVVVLAANVSSASLQIEDRPNQLSLDLPDWSLGVMGNAGALTHAVHLQTNRQGTIALQGERLPIDRFETDLEAKGESVVLDRLLLRAGQSQLTARGKVQDLERLDLTTTAEIALGEVARIGKINEPISGTLHAETTLRGPIDNPEIAGSVNATDVAVRGLRELAIDGKAQWAQGRLQVGSLQLSSPTLGSLSANGNLAVKAGTGTSRIEARLNGVRLQPASKELKLPVNLASSISGSATATFNELDWRTAAGSADLRLEPSGHLAADTLPVSGQVRVDGKNRVFTAELTQLSALGAIANGTIDLTGFNNLGGTVQASVPELDAFAVQLNTFLKREAVPPLRGTLELAGDLGGTVNAPTASVMLQSSNVALRDLQGIALEASAAYSPERLDLRELHIGWQNQDLTANGHVGLQGASPTLNLDARVDQASIADILRGLGYADLPLEGTFDLKAQVRGTAASPEAQASIRTGPLKAYGEPFAGLHAEAQLANQQLHLSQLELSKESGSLLATGDYGVESRAYQLKVETQDMRLTNLELPGGQLLRGTLGLNATGSGSLDNPQLAATIKLTETQLGERRLGEIAAEADVANQLATLKLNAPQLAVTSNAQVGTQAPYKAQIKLEATGTDLSQLQIALGEGRSLAGQITAQVEGSGSLSDWESGSVSLNASDLRLVVSGNEVRNVSPIQLRFDKGVLDVQSLQLATGQSSIEASGNLPLNQSGGSHSIQAKGSLDLPALLAFVPQMADVKAGGTLRLAAEVRGTLRNPVPTATVHTDGASLEHPELRDPLEAIQLDATYQDDRIDLRQLSAKLGEATISASGVVPLHQGDAKLQADLKGLQLSSLRQAPEGIASKITLHLEAQSPRVQELAAARANITFSELEVGYRDLQLKQEVPTNITLEQGVARIRALRLSGPESSLEAAGTIAIEGQQTLDLTAKGTLDAALVTLFTDSVQAQGESEFQLAVRGTLNDPDLSGFFQMKGGHLAVTAPEIVAEDLNLRLELSRDHVAISSLSGTLNGGEMHGSGFAEYSPKGIGNIDLNLNAKDAFFDIPKGLKTQVQAALRIRNVEENIEIGGKVQVVEGAFREPLDPETQLFQMLRSSRLELIEERNPALEKIRFNVEVNTTEPILIQNNLMELALNANIRLVGSYYQPGILGRMSIEEGGEIYVNERRYFIERGNVSFINPRDIKPDLDIVATTRVSSYDITLNLSGGADNYSASFTSPGLSEPDVISLLITGRKVDQTSGQESAIAREQALSLLTGAAASRISTGAQRTLGLSEVRIEPNLISAESDPGARLTVGQSITDFLRFIYSMNLRDSNDQIQILEWDVTRRFVGRSTRQADNTYRFDFNHNVSFGGFPDLEAKQTKRERQRIGEVRFEGNSVFPSKALLDELDMKPGSEYSFFKVHKQLDNVRKFYTSKGYLEARVRTSRNTHDRTVDLNVNVREGPRVRFVFEGYEVSRRTRRQVRRSWREGFIDVQRLRDSINAIRNELSQEGFPQAELRHEVTLNDGVKRVLFEIEPGLRYHDVELAFERANVYQPSVLRGLLDKAGLLEKLQTEPRAVSDFLTRYYHQRGFLRATVSPPRYDLDPQTRTGRIVIAMKEGPLFHFGELRFEGNESLSSTGLENDLRIAQGDRYDLQTLRDSVTTVEERYWRRGFNNVEVSYTLDRHDKQSAVDVVYRIKENLQEIVKDVNIEGNHKTSRNLVRTQLEMKPGDVLDYRKASESRRNLYSTGAYALVEVQKNALGDPTAAGTQQPVSLDVKVREVKPHNLRYGASYDTERGPGIIVDYLNRNTLGAARSLGFRARYDSEFRELRTYFGQPLLRRFPVKTTFSGFGSRQVQEFFITDRTGFSLQQEARPWESTLISYGYRFERTHTFDKDPDSPFQLVPFNVAPLTVSYSRDTRDELLDASRGSLFSHAFDYAPELFGSDIRFVRYFGQYFKYLPLGAPMEIPFARGAARARLVYAGGVRVGLGKGLGDQDLVRTERFFAGGSTTLRGFKRDEVGPRDGVGPTGGNAVFLTNNELRFPLISLLDGVGFLDVGNVYSKISDFSLGELRKSGGIGLRVRTPYFLLRLDYGIVLDKKPGEPRTGFYFSIGQAF